MRLHQNRREQKLILASAHDGAPAVVAAPNPDFGLRRLRFQKLRRLLPVHGCECRLAVSESSAHGSGEDSPVGETLEHGTSATFNGADHLSAAQSQARSGSRNVPVGVAQSGECVDSSGGRVDIEAHETALEPSMPRVIPVRPLNVRSICLVTTPGYSLTMGLESRDSSLSCVATAVPGADSCYVDASDEGGLDLPRPGLQVGRVVRGPRLR